MVIRMNPWGGSYETPKSNEEHLVPGNPSPSLSTSFLRKERKISPETDL